MDYASRNAFSFWSANQWLQVRRGLEELLLVAVAHDAEDPCWQDRIRAQIQDVDAIVRHLTTHTEEQTNGSP